MTVHLVGEPVGVDLFFLLVFQYKVFGDLFNGRRRAGEEGEFVSDSEEWLGADLHSEDERVLL